MPKLIGYTCHGKVRGQCGILHATHEEAEKHCEQDCKGCRSQGGYSDREIMPIGSDGILYYDEGLTEWVPGLGGRTSGAAQAECPIPQH